MQIEVRLYPGALRGASINFTKRSVRCGAFSRARPGSFSRGASTRLSILCLFKALGAGVLPQSNVQQSQD